MKLDLKLLIILILAATLILTNLFHCNQSKQDRSTIELLNQQIAKQDSLIQIRTHKLDSISKLPAKIKYKYAIKKDSIQYLSADERDSILRTITGH